MHRNSPFVKTFLQLNACPDFNGWELVDGMRFGDPRQWWGRNAPRHRGHEGVDLYRYRISGRTVTVTASHLFPVVAACELVNISRDFLGKTLWLLLHRPPGRDGLIEYVAMGHMEPAATMRVGCRFTGDAVAGRIASANGRVPPHLHISWFTVPDVVAADRLDWSSLQEIRQLRFWDPMPLVS